MQYNGIAARRCEHWAGADGSAELHGVTQAAADELTVVPTLAGLLVVVISAPSGAVEVCRPHELGCATSERYLGARVFVTLRAAIRAKTQSRSAGVMIAGHTAGPITCP